jgi:signal transduction histidine kinase
LRIWTQAQNGHVRLWIEDNGIGIVAPEKSKLFELFRRLDNARNYEGSGIGLAVVQRTVRKMGGEVGVESESGKGSRFWIKLRAP